MQRILRVSLIVFTCFWVSSALALPSKGTLTGDISAIRGLLATERARDTSIRPFVENIRSFELIGRLPGRRGGKIPFKVTLSQKRNFRDLDGDNKGNRSLHLKGNVYLKNGELLRVGTSVLRIAGKDQLWIDFKSSRGITKFVGTLDKDSNHINGYYHIVPSYALMGSCGTASQSHSLLGGEGESGSASNLNGVGLAVNSATRVFEVATDSDEQFTNAMGGNPDSVIQSSLNSAETIYQSQLNLVFDLVRQKSWTTANPSPYNGTSSGCSGTSCPSSNGFAGCSGMLELFTNYTTNNPSYLGTAADIRFLFSGKSMGGVLGVAWGATACSLASCSNGVSFTTNTSILYIVFAHEAGHTLAMSHDGVSSGNSCSATGFIMSTTLTDPSNPPTQFSSCSISEASTHVAQNATSSCLKLLNTPTPTPTPTPGTGSSTPTPTPSSGGGSTGGGGGPDGGGGPLNPQLTDASISLTSSLSSSGSLSLEISSSFGRSIDIDTCQLLIRVGPLSSKLSSVSPIAIDIPSGSTGINANASITIPRRALSGTVSIRADLSCPGEQESSNVKKLKPTGISAKNKVSLTSWVKLLKKLIKQAFAG